MNLDDKELTDYILNLPKEKRIKLLQSDEIRNKYLELCNRYQFLSLIQKLDNDIKYFIDDEYLSKIIASKDGVYKIRVLMTCENKNSSDILARNFALNFILKEGLLIKNYVKNLNYIFGKYLIDYAVKKNDSSIIKYLGFLSRDEQVKTFTNDYIIKILELSSDNYLFKLDGKVINKLIKYQPFLDEFMSADIKTLNKIVENDFIFPNNLLNSKRIIEKYVNIKNPNKYRYSVNLLMKNNYELASNIEIKRKDYVKKVITRVNNKGYLKGINQYFNHKYFDFDDEFLFYKTSLNLKKCNKNKLIQEYIRLTKILQLELIIDTYFKDIPYNFLSNLSVMLRYINQIDMKIIKISHLKLYNQLYNFYNLPMKERINLINSFDDKIDYAKMFYDDYRKCKHHSYKLMNDKVLKLDKNNGLYNKELSDENGVDIYELNGEEFYAYVHATNKYRNNDNINNLWYNNTGTICISLISYMNIKTYNDGIIFGFLNLRPNNIMHVYHCDSFSSQGIKKVNQIYTPENLVENTLGYNEILYSENHLKELNPDFIVCFDYITKQEIYIAKKMGIPIVKVNSKKYKREVYYSVNDGKNSYIKELDDDPIMEGKCLCRKY